MVKNEPNNTKPAHLKMTSHLREYQMSKESLICVYQSSALVLKHTCDRGFAQTQKLILRVTPVLSGLHYGLSSDTKYRLVRVLVSESFNKTVALHFERRLLTQVERQYFNMQNM